MTSLSSAEAEKVRAIAERHGFTTAATLVMLAAVIRGNGGMAQFNDPEFGGPGQWMAGGMTMVSDMFNERLKTRVQGVAADLSTFVLQRRSASPFGEASVESNDDAWWPQAFGAPTSTGAQNDTKYAYFGPSRRLAIARGTEISVYDTGDHVITGFSQQQATHGTMKFTSQHGTVDVDALSPVTPGRGV